MDLYKTIRMLHEERDRLDKLIASLEELKLSKGVAGRQKLPGRRGRKSMSMTERQEISVRMKKYWEARRASSKPVAETAAEPPAASDAASPAT